MEKIKHFTPYLIMLQTLIMGAIDGFGLGTVIALCVSAYLIKYFDQQMQHKIAEKEILLAEVDAIRSSSILQFNALTQEINALKSNITDLKLQKGTSNVQESKIPNQGRRF